MMPSTRIEDWKRSNVRRRRTARLVVRREQPQASFSAARPEAPSSRAGGRQHGAIAPGRPPRPGHCRRAGPRSTRCFRRPVPKATISPAIPPCRRSRTAATLDAAPRLNLSAATSPPPATTMTIDPPAASSSALATSNGVSSPQSLPSARMKCVWWGVERDRPSPRHRGADLAAGRDPEQDRHRRRIARALGAEQRHHAGVGATVEDRRAGLPGRCPDRRAERSRGPSRAAGPADRRPRRTRRSRAAARPSTDPRARERSRGPALAGLRDDHRCRMSEPRPSVAATRRALAPASCRHHRGDPPRRQSAQRATRPRSSPSSARRRSRRTGPAGRLAVLRVARAQAASIAARPPRRALEHARRAVGAHPPQPAPVRRRSRRRAARRAGWPRCCPAAAARVCAWACASTAW